MTRRIALICSGVLLLVGVFIAMDWYLVIPESSEATYVGRDQCIKCHQKQADLFHGSHHDMAMDRANEETVLANFNDQTLTSFGVESKFYRENEKFMVRTEGPDGELSDFEVKYVFGVEPLQQYMVEFDRAEGMPEEEIARLQVLSLCWDTEKKEWFQLQPPDVKEKIEPDDPLHWTGRTQCWNTSCADCHSTNLQKNFDLDSGTYHTTFSEIDVSCEACHGPGSHHVQMAESWSLFWDRKKGYGLAKLKGEDATTQIETCAKCHSRRGGIQDGFCGGMRYHDFYTNELLMDQTYHDDGQIKDEVYVYGSFLQSKMYHEGIRCTDCHDPHTTKVKFEGNQLCTSCHAHPAGKYDTVNHHRHKAGSTGALCVECHMPETTYMKVDPRRDHSIRIPRPDLSVELQTPNACTQCHIDESKLPAAEQKLLAGKQYLDWLTLAKTNQVVADELARLDRWSNESVVKWHGTEKQTPHFATVFHQIRKDHDSEDAIDALRKMLSDRKTPDIVRGTAAVEYTRSPAALRKIVNRAFLGSDKDLMSPALKQLQTEESTLAIQGLLQSIEVEINNIIAASWKYQSLSQLSAPLSNYLSTLIKLHEHPIRLIRIEASRVLLRIPYRIRRLSLDTKQLELVESVFDELISSVKSNQERGSALLALGSIYQLKTFVSNQERKNASPGDIALSDKYFELARQAYRDAIRIAPNESGARANLAAMNDEVLQRYSSQISEQASAGNVSQELSTKFAMLSRETEKLRTDELAILEKEAARAVASNAGAAVIDRYAMSLYVDGQVFESEKQLRIAVKMAPENPMIVLHFTLILEKQKKFKEALEYAERLLKLVPDNPSYQLMRNNLFRAANE